MFNRLTICPVCGSNGLYQDGKIYLDVNGDLIIEFHVECTVRGCDYRKDFKDTVYGL